MSERISRRRYWVFFIGFCLAALTAPAAVLGVSQIAMKDGRNFEGKVAPVASVGEVAVSVPVNGAPQVQSILLCDDSLRRIFVPKQQVLNVIESPASPEVAFNVRQYVAKTGATVSQLGMPLRVDDFDDFGRRIFRMKANQGALDVVQGITRITPFWTKVESLHMMKGKSFVWDMRIATSSIPPDRLRMIVSKQINPKKIEDRLKVVALFLQGQRYQDAQIELDRVIHDFPESKQRFDAALRDLRQEFARRALSEIEVRTAAGQHTLASSLLQNFPVAGVAGETVQAIKQALDEYRIDTDRYNEIQRKLDELIGKLSKDEQRRVEAMRDELRKELNLNTLGRMASFRQFWDDPELTDQEKASLGISGWLVGSDDALRKLPIAISLIETRNLVRRYLAEPKAINRVQLLAELAAQEAATPELVAKLLRYMLPPVETPKPAGAPAGFYELSVNGMPGEAPTYYHVQLPPEYDPHRLYRAVVTLHGAGTTPRQQIDWWAGAAAENGQRVGQASRYGYIIIAPAWAKEGQRDYFYSASEHAAVLNSLRDACRRFSIDTDRVFITGHSMGGDAAWDMALSHPDLWAGAMPVVARADMYISRLWQNMERVPFYLVGGEFDGDKTKHNALDLDRYLNHNFNATVVEYLGRGHEHFSDEILRLFDWMNRHQRNFYPKEFTTFSMRPWDNFFWWLELDAFSDRTMIFPEEWPKKGVQAAQSKGLVNATNGLVAKSGAKKAIIWLSPDVVNFKHKITITFNGGRARIPGSGLEPSLKVLLEDARTRADRLHPFWAKIEMPSNRINDGEGEAEEK
ncbi:MAG TPA: peptidase [Pirellulales bacterium]